MAGEDTVALREMADYSARGMASEAMQLYHSHEQLDNLRFTTMDKKTDEIKASIEQLSIDMKAGFKAYDSKFWSLAIVIITLLGSAIGILVTNLLHTVTRSAQ